MKSKGIWYLLSAFLWLAVVGGLYGQEIRGLIVGNVTDPTGAAVPGLQPDSYGQLTSFSSVVVCVAFTL